MHSCLQIDINSLGTCKYLLRYKASLMILIGRHMASVCPRNAFVTGHILVRPDSEVAVGWVERGENHHFSPRIAGAKPIIPVAQRSFKARWMGGTSRNQTPSLPMSCEKAPPVLATALPRSSRKAMGFAPAICLEMTLFAPLHPSLYSICVLIWFVLPAMVDRPILGP
jgi:hypothetical protein